MITYLSLISWFFVGILITAFLTIIFLPIYLKWGLSESYELYESQCIAKKLTRAKTSENLTVLGLVLHLINGGLLAVPLFLLLSIFPFERTENIIFGIIYGILVWTTTLAPVHQVITGKILISENKGYMPILASILFHIIFGVIISLF